VNLASEFPHFRFRPFAGVPQKGFLGDKLVRTFLEPLPPAKRL
jgi:hypothetical protein